MRVTNIRISVIISAILCTAAAAKTIYVDDDAAGANDGSSWTNAYVYLQEALADAKISDKPVEIRVAQGTYKPNGGIVAIPEFDWRTLTFQLISGVSLKGGYAGVGQPDPDNRDVTAPTTGNLAGEWFLAGSDIQDNHTWDGLVTIDSTGSVTGGTLASSEGSVYQFTGGDMAIDATGKVTGTVLDSDGITTRLTMQMDVRKSIMAGEGNAITSEEDGIFVFVKKSSGFTTENLAGEWFLAGSDIQDNHTWDGLVTIDSTGSVTGGTLASSEGSVYQFTGGDLAIDANGKVTGTVLDSDGITTRLTMQMDVGKSIMAGEGNATTSEEDGIFVFVKKSSGFTTVNLAGEWFLGASDIQDNHTWDGLVTIDSTGSVTGGTLASSEGSVYQFTGGDLAINATGKVTGSVTDSDGITTRLTMQMDVGKSIMAGEGNATISEEDGVFVFVRITSGYETILSGDLAGDDIEVADPRDLLTEPSRAENSDHVVTSYQTDETAMLDGFTITGGNANYSGGGIDCSYCSAIISNNRFIGNSAIDGGGGIALAFSRSTIVKNTITENSAGTNKGGGGIYCGAETYATIKNNIIKKNFAQQRGGGISCHIAFPTLINNLIAENSADYGGGMENHVNSHPILMNCTFIRNKAYEYGDCIYNDSSSAPLLTNCILWDNIYRGRKPKFQVLGGEPVFNFCCIQGWTTELGGTGNIDADPLFANPENGDYHLKSQAGRWDPNSESWVIDDVTSPCIDAGDPTVSVGDEPEPNGGRINMGVYGGTSEASMSLSNE